MTENCEPFFPVTDEDSLVKYLAIAEAATHRRYSKDLFDLAASNLDELIAETAMECLKAVHEHGVDSEEYRLQEKGLKYLLEKGGISADDLYREGLELQETRDRERTNIEELGMVEGTWENIKISFTETVEGILHPKDKCR